MESSGDLVEIDGVRFVWTLYDISALDCQIRKVGIAGTDWMSAHLSL